MAYSDIHQGDSHRDPLAPQSLVVANGVVDPDIAEQRARNNSKLYPLHDRTRDLEVRRAEWFFSLAGNNARRHRNAQMNADDIVGFSSASGLLGNEDIVFRGCVDYPGEPANDDGSAAPRFGLSLRMVGNASGFNTGRGLIRAGDDVYWDWPATVTDPSGVVLPAWQPDWNPTKFFFATKSMSPHTVESSVAGFFGAIMAGADDTPVHITAAAAQKQFTIFPDMTGDLEPLARFAKFFASPPFDQITHKMLRATMQYIATTPAKSFSKEMKHFADAYHDTVVFNPRRLSERATLDNMFQKNAPLLPVSSKVSHSRYAWDFFGILYIMSELFALRASRYMGRALAPANPGRKMDLLLP